MDLGYRAFPAPMTEVLFYHLLRQSLEAALPILVQRSLDRGWHVIVQASSPERLAALDDALWTYSDESFLPHAPDNEADGEREAVILTLSDVNSNRAQIRFIVEGAPLPQDIATYERLVVLFDGNDDAALSEARAKWSSARAQGHVVTYWQQDDAGRWEKKA